LRPWSQSSHRIVSMSRNPHISIIISSKPHSPALNDPRFFSRFKYHIDHKTQQNSSRARANEICKRSIPKKNLVQGLHPLRPPGGGSRPLFQPHNNLSAQVNLQITLRWGQNWGDSPEPVTGNSATLFGTLSVLQLVFNSISFVIRLAIRIFTPPLGVFSIGIRAYAPDIRGLFGCRNWS